MKCPTSHLERDGQLVDVFPARSEEPGVVVYQIVTVETEAFPGRHIVFDPMVKTCPTCHIHVGRPFARALGVPDSRRQRAGEPYKRELALNRYHQARR